jgi:hypothetical protein
MNFIKEEAMVDHQKVYIGCIFEKKEGIESTKPPKVH